MHRLSHPGLNIRGSLTLFSFRHSCLVNYELRFLLLQREAIAYSFVSFFAALRLGCAGKKRRL